MTQMEASRRSIIGALTIASIAGSAAMAAMPAGASRNRAAWESALADFERADRACLADDALWGAAKAEWDRREPKPTNVDWHAFPFVDRDEIAHREDLDERWAKWLAGEGKSWWPGNRPGARDQMIARQKASFDSVRKFRDEHDRVYREVGLVDACDRNDRLNDARSEALDRLLAMPAPDGPALMWKLDYVLDCGTNGFSSGWNEDFLAPIVADARRLLMGGLR